MSRRLAAFAAILTLTASFMPGSPAYAEDCTGLLPNSDCVLDENTTAPLTIDEDHILYVSGFPSPAAPLEINHTIDSDTSAGNGGLFTVGNGGTVLQQADIGSVNALTSMTVETGDFWYLSGGADLVMSGSNYLQLDGATLGVAPGSGLSMISAGVLGGPNADNLDFISGGVSYGTTGTIGKAGTTINLGAGYNRILYYQSQGSTIAADGIVLGDDGNLFAILGDSSTSVFSGYLTTGAGVDTITFVSSNATLGSSSSVFSLGAGDDIIDFDSGGGVAGGTLHVGTLNMGSGMDTISLADNATLIVSTSFDAGDDNDTITFTSGGFLGGFFDVRGATFTMGDGDDTIDFDTVAYTSSSGMDATGATFTMGDGNDNIIFRSSVSGLNAPGTVIGLGAGDDTISFLSTSGTIRMASGSGLFSVDGGAGTDTIYFDSSAIIEYGSADQGSAITNVESIDLGGGKLTYYGTIDSAARLFNFTSAHFLGVNTDIIAYISGSSLDDDIAFASGATLSGTLSTADGDDSLVFDSATLAAAGTVTLGAGDDTVTATNAVLAGTISFGSGNDTLTDSGSVISGSLGFGNGNDTATLTGSTVSGTLTFGSGNDNLSAGGGAAISGTVNGGGDAGDMLAFTAGTTTVTGTVLGFSSAEVMAGATLNLRGTGTVDLDLGGLGTVQFGSAGSSAYTFTLSHTMDDVSVDVAGDTVDTNGIDLGTTAALHGLSVGTDALLMVDSNIDASDGALSVDGTLRMATTARITADSYNNGGTAGEFVFEIKRTAGATQLGTITLDNAANIDFAANNDVFRFVLGSGSQPLVSDTVSFISTQAGGFATAPLAANVYGSSILYFMSVGNADDHTLQLAVQQRNTIDGIASNETNATIGHILLEDLAGSSDAGINTLQSALLNSSTEGEFNDNLSSITPIVNGGDTQSVRSISKQTFGLINQRLAMLRKDDNGNSGISTGNLVNELKAWWEFFTLTGKQGERGNADGYDLTTYGFSGGIDKEVIDDGFLGLSLTYGTSSVDSRGQGNAQTDVGSYGVSLYGDYDFGRAYINAAASYSLNAVSTQKTTVAGDRSGDFHGHYYGLRTEIGYSFMPGKTRLIPYLMGQYGYYSPQAYTEQGPGAQNIAGDSVTTLEAGAGLVMNWLIRNGDASWFVPEMRLAYTHDFSGDPVSTTANFVAGGPSFTVQGADPAEDAFDFGLGMTYYSKEDWELLFRYDMQYKADYISHAGMIRAAYRFY